MTNSYYQVNSFW